MHLPTQPRNIAIIGSTGSIGTQALDIVDRYPGLYRVTVLAAGTRVDQLAAQALKHRPQLAIIANESLLPRLQQALDGSGIETAAGPEALCQAMARPDVETVLTATVGYSGLAPTIAAIKAGKDIALANKETLVVAGELIEGMLRTSPSRIYPVDSEHSAIAQCLVGEDPASVTRLIVTASGGPFRNFTPQQLEKVTPAQALNHPNWAMGPKITIDSATMMNKAFELIEARWLFGIDQSRISAVVHPQSVVHSMVQFADGAIKAQLGVPDMCLPIAYALGQNVRLPGVSAQLTLEQMTQLTFEAPDTERFPCLTLADTASRMAGTAACTINAANEIANLAFREGRIGFADIYRVIEHTLHATTHVAAPQYEDYVAVNDEARRRAAERVERIERSQQ